MNPLYQMTYILSFLLLFTTSCKTANELPKSEVKVNTSYAFDFVESELLVPVLDKAAEDDKLIFLDIYTTWCLPCKLMDRDVFSHEETAEIFNKDFISYKVDAEKGEGPDLSLIYNVSRYPTLLFLDSKGRVLARKEGVAYHNELLKLAEEAKLKSITQ